MKMNEGVEWAVHSCSLLASLPPGAALSARKLAEFFDLPDAYLAKTLQILSNAGIVSTRKGPKGGYFLARSAKDISLLAIVEAIDGTSPCFRCTEIRQRGPTGDAKAKYSRPCGIARAMLSAEKAWRRELAKTSLHEIQVIGVRETHPIQVEKAAKWFAEAMA